MTESSAEIAALRAEIAQLRSANRGHPHGCTACRGSGTYRTEKYVPHIGGGGYETFIYNCPSCNGRGSIYPQPKCSYPRLRQGR